MNYRFYPDFTGADPRRHPEWHQPPFQDTVDIGRYQELSPEAGSVSPHFTGFELDDDNVLYGVSYDGVRHVFDEVELKTPANDSLNAIGISGFAQTGKTTVANYIEAKYGYRRQHIAEPLRDMLRTLLLWFDYEPKDIDRYLTGDLKESIIPCLGITSRRAQITLGTEWGRELVNDDLWANLWAFQAAREGGNVMNDSVRFPNEETAIQGGLLGFTIMIVRPGTRPAAFTSWFGRKLYDWFGLMWGVHPSERVDLLNPDFVVVNDGTVEELYEQIDRIMLEAGVACVA